MRHEGVQVQHVLVRQGVDAGGPRVVVSVHEPQLDLRKAEVHKGQPVHEAPPHPDDHDDPGTSTGVRGGDDARFDPRTLHDSRRRVVFIFFRDPPLDVASPATPEQKSNLFGALEGRFGRLLVLLPNEVRLDPRDEFPRKIQTRLFDVGDHNGPRSGSPHRGQGDQTDRSGTTDQDRLADGHRPSALSDGVEVDRERLQEGPLDEGHGVRDLVAVPSFVGHEAANRPSVADAQKSHRFAQVVLARRAEETSVAGELGLDGDSVPGLQVADGRPRLQDDPGRFVAQDVSVVHGQGSYGASMPQVQIRSTDSRRADVYQHLCR